MGPAVAFDFGCIAAVPAFAVRVARSFGLRKLVVVANSAMLMTMTMVPRTGRIAVGRFAVLVMVP